MSRKKHKNLACATSPISGEWRRLSGTLQKAARASRIEGNRPSKDGALTLHMSNSFHPLIPVLSKYNEELSSEEGSMV